MGPLLNMKSMILWPPPPRLQRRANPSSSSSSRRITTPRSRSTLLVTRRNGIVVSESGVQKQIGAKADEAGTVSQGSYSFPEDGRRYTVNWVADENGFQAKGDHLPTPPPLPEHVVKLLQDLIAAGL